MHFVDKGIFKKSCIELLAFTVLDLLQSWK